MEEVRDQLGFRVELLELLCCAVDVEVVVPVVDCDHVAFALRRRPVCACPNA